MDGGWRAGIPGRMDGWLVGLSVRTFAVQVNGLALAVAHGRLDARWCAVSGDVVASCPSLSTAGYSGVVWIDQWTMEGDCVRSGRVLAERAVMTASIRDERELR